MYVHMNTCTHISRDCVFKIHMYVGVCVCMPIKNCVCCTSVCVHRSVYVHMMTAFMRNGYKLVVCIGTHKSVEEDSGVKVQDGLVLAHLPVVEALDQ